MTAYLLLLILLLVLFLAALRFSGYMLLAPVPLALLGLSVSLVLAVIGLSSWNHISLEWESVCIVVLGSASLLLGAFLARHLSDRQIARPSSRGAPSSTYTAPIWKYALVAAVLIIAIVVRVVETYRIGAELGADMSSYSAVARAVRSSLAGIMSTDGMRFGVGFSFVERQLEKVATVAGYVSAYLLAHNVSNNRRAESVAAAGLLLLSCVFCIAIGGRTAILLYCIALAASLYICLLRKGRSSSKLAGRFFAIGAVACCIAAAAFYAVSPLIGRPASSGFVEYISFYFGCGTPSLQHLLNSVDLPVVAPGVRTFYYLFSVPYKLGLIDTYPSYSIAWVDMGGHGCNIFTGFARYYLDFGLPGVMVLSVLAGAFMTLVYRMAANKGKPFLIVFSGYLCAYSFDFAREEFIFSRLLSPTQLFFVVIMFVITLFLTTSLKEDWRRISSFVVRKRVA